MIVSLTEAKGYLGITATDEDAEITRLILVVQEALESDCNRKFESAVVTETLDGDGDTMVLVGQTPVGIPNYGTDSYVNIDGVDTPETNLYVYPETGEISLKSGVFACGRRNIEIKYTGGYSSDDMPEDIKQAILERVKQEYDQKTTGEREIRTKKVGEVSITYETSSEKKSLSQQFYDRVVRKYGRIIMA